MGKVDDGHSGLGGDRRVGIGIQMGCERRVYGEDGDGDSIVMVEQTDGKLESRDQVTGSGCWDEYELELLHCKLSELGEYLPPPSSWKD